MSGHNLSDTMTRKKIYLCLMLPTVYSTDFPSRPAVIEIYGGYLPNLGHKIDWITPCHIKNETRLIKFKKVKVYAVYYPFKNSVYPLRIYGFVKYYYNKFKLLNKKFKSSDYNIIQVRNNIFDSLLALYIKWRYNVPFVFQYSFPEKDIYKIRAYKSPFGILLGNINALILDFVLKRADFIFPITAMMGDEMVASGLNYDKIMPVPMGVNLDLFVTKNRDEIRNRYKLDDIMVFLYVGSLDSTRKLDVIIKAFSIVNIKHKKTKLLILGDGRDKHELKMLVSKLNLENMVIFTGNIPYFDVPKFISAADVCLCPVPPLEIFKVSSPTKLFEYMSINKPIVANYEIPEHKKVLEDSGAGILVKFEPESFAEGMIKLIELWYF